MDNMSTKQKRTITIDGQEIPTHQTLWEMNRKTNQRIDRAVRTLMVLATSVIIIGAYCLLKQ